MPVGPVMQWTEERPLDPLELHVYPDDDGVSRANERGEWSMTRYSFRGETLTARREGRYEPSGRTVRILVHGDGAGGPREVVRDQPEWTVTLT